MTGAAILSTLYDLKNRNNRRKITKPHDATNYGWNTEPTNGHCMFSKVNLTTAAAGAISKWRLIISIDAFQFQFLFN